MTTPGDTVYIVVIESEGNRARLCPFASLSGAEKDVNHEIDSMKPFYATRFKDVDPGPAIVSERLYWWNTEMAKHVKKNYAYIELRQEIIED